MKKFAFALETLLRYRRNIEDKEKARFSELHSGLQSERERLQGLRARYEETLQNLGRHNASDGDRRETLWFYRYLDRLDLEMKKTDENIARLGKEMEEQKRVVIDSSKNRKILENLRDKREKAFARAQEKLEQKDIDELVVTRYVHRS